MARNKQIKAIENKIVGWAKRQGETRAVIEIGSQARADHPADEWSDIDLVIVSSHPVDSLTQDKWFNEVSNGLDDVWIVHKDRGETRHRAWIPFGTFVSGRQKVDLVLLIVPSETSTNKSLLQILEKSPFPYVFSEGVRLLWDSRSNPPSPPQTKTGNYTVRLPSDDDFKKHVASFWFHALQVGKLTARGELWCAEYTYYCSLRQELLRFIEWHSELLPKSQNRVWPRGRFLVEWADSRVFDFLLDHNSGNDFANLWHTLQNSCRIFEILASEIAKKQGYEYPFEQQARALDWLQDMENPA